MIEQKFKISSYRPSLEYQLMQLENEATQGSLIQLKMERDKFSSRSAVFDNYRIFVSLSDEDELQGVTAGAIVPLNINQKLEWVGIGYDLRVKKEWRRMGLARQFGYHLIENYFKASGINKFCTTAKKENSAVYKAARGLYQNWDDTSFIYLTISTGTRIKQMTNHGNESRFNASLLSGRESLKSWYDVSASGIGIFSTYKMYSLKVQRISPFVRYGIILRNMIKRSRMKVPVEGDELKFVTAFDITRENIKSFQGILDTLQDQGIHFCNVVCSRDDFIHLALKNYAINAYEYLLIRSFDVFANDRISIDVRCL